VGLKTLISGGRASSLKKNMLELCPEVFFWGTSPAWNNSRKEGTLN